MANLNEGNMHQCMRRDNEARQAWRRNRVFLDSEVSNKYNWAPALVSHINLAGSLYREATGNAQCSGIPRGDTRTQMLSEAFELSTLTIDVWREKKISLPDRDLTNMIQTNLVLIQRAIPEGAIVPDPKKQRKCPLIMDTLAAGIVLCEEAPATVRAQLRHHAQALDEMMNMFSEHFDRPKAQAIKEARAAPRTMGGAKGGAKRGAKGGATGLEVGVRVRISGVVSNPSLNGTFGEVRA